MPNKRKVKKVKTGFRTKSKTATRRDGTSVVKENISAKTLDRPFTGKVKSRIVYNPDGSIKRGRYKASGPNPDGTTGSFKVRTKKSGITTGTTTKSDGTRRSISKKNYKPRTGNDAAPYVQNDFKIGGMVGMPKYSNNPRVEQGRNLKYGGSCGRVIRGKNLRRSI